MTSGGSATGSAATCGRSWTRSSRRVSSSRWTSGSTRCWPPGCSRSRDPGGRILAAGVTDPRSTSQSTPIGELTISVVSERGVMWTMFSDEDVGPELGRLESRWGRRFGRVRRGS